MKEKHFSHSNPHLPVRNLEETLAYYREILGFYEEWTFGEKDGGIRRDDMRLLFGEDPAFVDSINNREHRLPIMWFCTNIDDLYEEFNARGIGMAAPLKTHSYGLREFAFIDINGYIIRVAEAVTEPQPSTV